MAVKVNAKYFYGTSGPYLRAPWGDSRVAVEEAIEVGPAAAAAQPGGPNCDGSPAFWC